MTPRHKFPTIEEQGIKSHVETLGVDFDKLVWLHARGLTNAAIGKALGKSSGTIKNWRKYL